MPPGYKCDRCTDFVEQPRNTFEEVHPPDGNPGEHVAMIDSDADRHEWTLCPDCRDALVGWVEDSRGSPLMLNGEEIGTLQNAALRIQQGYNRPTPAEQTATEIEALRRQYDPSRMEHWKTPLTFDS